MASKNSNLGNTCPFIRKNKTPIDHYKKRLEIFSAIGDRSAMASNNDNLGNAYLSLGDFEKAINDCEKGLENCIAIGDWSGVASNNINLGNAYLSLGDYKKAINYNEKGLDISTAIVDQSGIASNKGNLGNAYRCLGDYKKAISYYEKGLEISTAIGDQSGIGSNNGNLGNAYLSLGDYKKAISYYEKGLEVSTAIGDQSGIGSNNGNFGNAYLSLGDYKQAISYYEKGLEISTAIGDRSGIASNNGNLGEVYRCLGEYEKAIDYCRKSLEIFTEIGNLSGIASSNGNMGGVYRCLGEYGKAIDYCKKGLEISTAICDLSGMASNNVKLGEVYRCLGQYENAIDYCKRGLEISTAIGDRSGIATSNGNLGEVCRYLGEYEKAIDYCKKGLEVSTAIGDRSGMAINNGKLGEVYRFLGEYEKAIEYCKKGLEISTEISYRSGIARNYSNLGNCYINLEEYEKAMDYHQQALENCIEQSCLNHTDIAACYDNLGAVCFRLSELDKATDFYETALEIRKDKFGPNHVDVAVSYNNLSVVYRKSGALSSTDELEKAEHYHQLALEIRKERLTSNKADVSASYCNIEPYQDPAQHSILCSKVPDMDKHHIVKARSLALRFSVANPCCVRAIPYENDSKETKTFTMCLYVDTGGNGIPEDLKQVASEMFADYEIEYVDLERRPLCDVVTRLPASEKQKDKELNDLSKMIEKNLHVFENRLNVTAVQASYKVVDSREQDTPCVTVFVLGKGRIPIGETGISELDNSPFDVEFDVVEGYYQPCSDSYKSYTLPLLGGVGIGIDGDPSSVGTLGGFLEDEDGKRYILSCEHVLNPDENVSNPNIAIVQPAETDYKKALGKASSAVEAWRQRLKKQENRLNVATDEDYDRYKIRAQETREVLERMENDETKVAASKPRPIGNYCCGLKGNEAVEISDNNHVTIYVDAAIAELNDEEASEIAMEKDDEPENDCCPVFGFQNNQEHGFTPTGEIVDLQNFDSQHEGIDLGLMKIGRTTGLTGDGEFDTTNFFVNRYGYKKDTCAGDLSHVPYILYCNVCKPPTDDNQVDLSGMRKPCCAICNETIESNITALWAYNCMAIRRPKKPFCEKGDSGALVFDSQGRAWGMIFGIFTADDINVDFGLAAPLGVTLQALERTLRRKKKDERKKLTLWQKTGNWVESNTKGMQHKRGQKNFCKLIIKIIKLLFLFLLKTWVLQP